ncbi:transcriptional repressor [Iocasia frigidifontis]|uniref:Transcriptional repressor n=1 Tax=Iocasia fonsfrigidae TaxID=2682810 RepID=A0A8A7KGM7_9FIRM|nr:transcriptional repressor [Iocasia fonsfrigidae]QTL98878.1 transcriptional repressor [Iocasia fonsfrigidae]
MSEIISLVNELERKNIKVTQQRRIILGILNNNKGEHLSARDIYTLGKDIDDSIGLSTVYRTLNLLRDVGIIAEYHFDKEFAKYELSCQKEQDIHHHLICKNCGKIIEVENYLPGHFKDEIYDKNQFICQEFSLKVSGLCKECQQLFSEEKTS